MARKTKAQKAQNAARAAARAAARPTKHHQRRPNVSSSAFHRVYLDYATIGAFAKSPSQPVGSISFGRGDSATHAGADAGSGAGAGAGADADVRGSASDSLSSLSDSTSTWDRLVRRERGPVPTFALLAPDYEHSSGRESADASSSVDSVLADYIANMHSDGEAPAADATRSFAALGARPRSSRAGLGWIPTVEAHSSVASLPSRERARGDARLAGAAPKAACGRRRRQRFERCLAGRIEFVFGARLEDPVLADRLAAADAAPSGESPCVEGPRAAYCDRRLDSGSDLDSGADAHAEDGRGASSSDVPGMRAGDPGSNSSSCEICVDACAMDDGDGDVPLDLTALLTLRGPRRRDAAAATGAPAVGRHPNGRKATRAKGPRPSMTIVALQQAVDSFVGSPERTRMLPSLNKTERKQLCEFARVYGVGVSARGSGKRQLVELRRTGGTASASELAVAGAYAALGHRHAGPELASVPSAGGARRVRNGARGPGAALVRPPLSGANWGHQLLCALGWDGGPLGRAGADGLVEPLSVVLRRHRRGIGAS